MQSLHKMLVVHGDVKLANFCLSGGQSSQVHIVDFGFSFQCHGVPLGAEVHPQFRGTADFASDSALLCGQSTYADDLGAIPRCSDLAAFFTWLYSSLLLTVTLRAIPRRSDLAAFFTSVT